ncbi:MAG: ribonuclease II [Chloroflexi bacterium HGW-Chloroflexi-6]|nr:MAG: ribonuclease II [Chloroflexi bacterium HGW-Chloroflexi-6]
MNANNPNHRAILQKIARQAMLERGLLPDFSGAVIAELKRLRLSAPGDESTVRDKCNLLWASLDNDDSRDLDQLTFAEALPDGRIKILVAIADVDTFVKNDSELDKHARHNTTSAYTAAQIFPMLPEEISTDITSLNFDQDRLAVIVEMVVDEQGTLQDSKIYRAWVRNHAKLAYNSVAAWLDKKGEMPDEMAEVPGLAEILQLQDQAAQRLKKLRHINGALSLETIEAKLVFDGDQLYSLDADEKNSAKQIIEDFMIAANGITARFLSARGFPSIRRVVRTPKRWERIVEIARSNNYTLPAEPDSKALDEFLVQQKAANPLRFPDLSLAVVKLLGAGEYAAEIPGGDAPGHFGLAVKDYAHSTAPNRRYPDLLTQRLLKAALDAKPAPYSKDELDDLAAHCTKTEDAVNKVERQVEKSAAALLLESRIGEKFDAIVTGASEKGTWVRLLSVPVEGKVVQGFEGMDVGEQVSVQLIDTNIERGFIDFKKVSSSKL